MQKTFQAFANFLHFAKLYKLLSCLFFLSWMSISSCPVLAVLFPLSIHGNPALAVLVSCPGGSVLS